MKRMILRAAAVVPAVLLSIQIASAHVVVKPAQVGLAAFQTFSIGVPNEKEIPVTGVRLVLPAGLSEVSPTVKSGWSIDTKKDGDEVTEISWTGGSIPSEQRDEFTFSAQAPASASTIVWKAYQTYSDGTVVAWDQDPATVKAGEEGTPYSTTKVFDDLATVPDTAADNAVKKANLALALGAAALVIAVISHVAQHRRKG